MAAMIRRLGRYEFHDVLGAGAFATVYRASDPSRQTSSLSLAGGTHRYQAPSNSTCRRPSTTGPTCTRRRRSSPC